MSFAMGMKVERPIELVNRRSAKSTMKNGKRPAHYSPLTAHFI
jgi:hypothetical protein